MVANGVKSVFDAYQIIHGLVLLIPLCFVNYCWKHLQQPRNSEAAEAAAIAIEAAASVLVRRSEALAIAIEQASAVQMAAVGAVENVAGPAEAFRPSLPFVWADSEVVAKLGPEDVVAEVMAVAAAGAEAVLEVATGVEALDEIVPEVGVGVACASRCAAVGDGEAWPAGYYVCRPIRATGNALPVPL